jgi:hypothetical protein
MGNRRLPELGVQVFTVDGVDIPQPMQKPPGQALIRAQHLMGRKIRQRVRIELVNSRVARCRRCNETIGLWKAGLRDMVMNSVVYGITFARCYKGV